MKLQNGVDWQPEDDLIIQWQRAYPKIDVFAELAKMDAWCESNPKKRRKDGKRFANAWLSRANDLGGSPRVFNKKQTGDSIPLRDWTELDCLTHDFTDSATVRDQFMQQFGQYVDHKGVRHES